MTAPPAAAAARSATRRRRAVRLLIALSLLPLPACDAVSVWLAGIDPENFTWEPPLGAAPPGPMEKALAECETRGRPPSAETPQGGPTIARSESSEAVADCMAEKGYQKVYQPRATML